MPHDIPAADVKKKVVIVGAGPAGMEAARVAAERGHDVTVFEAGPRAGGQILLTAQQKRRSEMIGIIDWRMEQCTAKGVKFNFNTYAEADDLTSLSPDVIILATGGLPQPVGLTSGEDLCVQAWDILSGDVKPGSNVLLYDDAGDHTALQTADALVAAGATVEIMTPDRSFAPEIMGMNLVPYMRSLQGKNVTFTVTYRLTSVAREGNKLRAVIGSDYRTDLAETRDFDQVVVNHGTAPNADLYFALKPLSENLGAVDYEALIDGRPQPAGNGPKGFRLYRIGDAVESRNTHASIYDALRLLKDI